MYIIYKITNKVNQKCYIGLTKNTITGRWYCHVSEAKCKNQKYKFHAALRKYDKTDWLKDVLCSCRTKADAEYLEEYFIEEYDTYKHGYNSTRGGNAFGGLHGSANGMYGKTHTTKAKAIFSKNATKTFKGKSYEELYGKERADELKELRSITQKKWTSENPCSGKNNTNAKRVHVKGRDFDFIKLAATFYGKLPDTISNWVKTRDDCWYL